MWALWFDIDVCDVKQNNYFKDLASKIVFQEHMQVHQYLVCYQTFSPQSVVKDMQIGRMITLYSPACSLMHNIHIILLCRY